MTKLRTPKTFAEAAALVGGQLGYAEAGKIAGRKARTIYEWANPDSDTAPTLPQALALDGAYRAAGGEGAPFRDAYEFQLGMATERQDACRIALLADVAIAAKEAGEAIAFAIEAARSNASPLAIVRALGEAAQATAALAAMERRLASFLPDDAGSVAGNDGGNP